VVPQRAWRVAEAAGVAAYWYRLLHDNVSGAERGKNNLSSHVYIEGCSVNSEIWVKHKLTEAQESEIGITDISTYSSWERIQITAKQVSRY